MVILPFNGSNRLEALDRQPLLRGSACALTLDEVQLAAIGIALRTVGKLARQAASVQCTLAPRRWSRGLCVPPRAHAPGLFNRLVDDLAGHRWILLEHTCQGAH